MIGDRRSDVLAVFDELAQNTEAHVFAFGQLRGRGMSGNARRRCDAFKKTKRRKHDSKTASMLQVNVSEGAKGLADLLNDIEYGVDHCALEVVAALIAQNSWREGHERFFQAHSCNKLGACV
jgi:hypothetical protein